jgi:hypothetical protein
LTTYYVAHAATAEVPAEALLPVGAT